MGERLRRRHTRGYGPLGLSAATWLAATAGVMFPAIATAGQTLFWLQTDGQNSQLGSVNNPVLNLDINETQPLYLWMDPDAISYGMDGISFDIRLITDDGGQASVSVTWDEPPGRWDGTTEGATRTDSGGVGVDDSNMIDLTNTDTVGSEPIRLGTLNITGVVTGKTHLYLCIGKYGVIDGGNSALIWLGLDVASTSPETTLVSGGISGQCSNVPEATINISSQGASFVGDFDSDGDTDQRDFAHLQECMSGVFPQTDPACDDASLDGDAYVDQDDVGIFLSCMNGANVTPPISCQN